MPLVEAVGVALPHVHVRVEVVVEMLGKILHTGQATIQLMAGLTLAAATDKVTTRVLDRLFLALSADWACALIYLLLLWIRVDVDH